MSKSNRSPLREVRAADAARIARLFPSFRDFVDDALFHPQWGYYSTGTVRFGDGGHYDTFPLALAPLFGRMLARYAFRYWRRRGRPARFEICELGAGNGQLCLDVLADVAVHAEHHLPWQRFATAMRYRIIERSPALIARQRQQLGPLARQVRWSRLDLSQGARRIYGHHSQNFFRTNIRDILLKRTHLIEQTQAFITRETVRAEANVESEGA